MPRRYATYEFNPSLAPLAEITFLHRAMTVGALIITVGTVLWLVNVVWSWKKGGEITDPDPWGTKEYGLHGREFAWFEQQLAATDGGEESVATDGGKEPGAADGDTQEA
jgi:cytochrome c oxidase subunit 1